VLVHVTVYGADVRTPRLDAPWKNSTCVTEPSLSDAVAVMATFVGARNVAPFNGIVILTTGAASTVTLTTADVAISPRLSVARAVNECTPLAAPFHVVENGGDVSEPTDVLPAKNTTWVIEPPGDVALAVMSIGVPGLKKEPLAGVVIATAG
jgi:hypothetical protein